MAELIFTRSQSARCFSGSARPMVTIFSTVLSAHSLSVQCSPLIGAPCQFSERPQSAYVADPLYVRCWVASRRCIRSGGECLPSVERGTSALGEARMNADVSPIQRGPRIVLVIDGDCRCPQLRQSQILAERAPQKAPKIELNQASKAAPSSPPAHSTMEALPAIAQARSRTISTMGMRAKRPSAENGKTAAAKSVMPENRSPWIPVSTMMVRHSTNAVAPTVRRTGSR